MNENEERACTNNYTDSFWRKEKKCDFYISDYITPWTICQEQIVKVINASLADLRSFEYGLQDYAVKDYMRAIGRLICLVEILGGETVERN